MRVHMRLERLMCAGQAGVGVWRLAPLGVRGATRCLKKQQKSVWRGATPVQGHSSPVPSPTPATPAPTQAKRAAKPGGPQWNGRNGLARDVVIVAHHRDDVNENILNSLSEGMWL